LGFFSELFIKKSPPSPRELELERQFIPIIMKDIASKEQAATIFKKLLKEAKEEITSDSHVPVNLGDYLLKAEKSNDKVNSMIAKRRLFGVSDEEIRVWWNKDDLERGLIKKFSEFQRMAIFSMLKNQGMSSKAASEKVKMCFPTYGEKDLSQHLPYELKEKIDAYIYDVFRSPEKAAIAKKEIEAAGSVNAYIVNKIDEGVFSH